jgi:hypothetical protein
LYIIIIIYYSSTSRACDGQLRFTTIHTSSCTSPYICRCSYMYVGIKIYYYCAIRFAESPRSKL